MAEPRLPSALGAVGAQVGAALADPQLLSLLGTAGQAGMAPAALLSATLALAAAVPLCAAALYNAGAVALQSWSGRGVYASVSFEGVDYARREPVIILLDLSTAHNRFMGSNVALLLSIITLLVSFPFAFAQYLGASRRVCAFLMGSSATAWALMNVGWVVFGIGAFLTYLVLVGFITLYLSLRMVSPRGSQVPKQALRTMIIVAIGNVLLQSVPNQANVRNQLACLSVLLCN
jgi:hypothetical protein